MSNTELSRKARKESEFSEIDLEKTRTLLSAAMGFDLSPDDMIPFPEESTNLMVSTKVLAQKKGGNEGKYYAATITAINGDSTKTYNVVFDDDDNDKRTELQLEDLATLENPPESGPWTSTKKWDVVRSILAAANPEQLKQIISSKSGTNKSIFHWLAMKEAPVDIVETVICATHAYGLPNLCKNWTMTRKQLYTMLRETTPRQRW
jgi:hypothetical protein